MSFSQSTITDLQVGRSGTDLLVSWSSTSADGTTYQVYANHVLAWWGTALQTMLPYPAASVRIDVGTVAAGEGATDFSGGLTAPDNLALLSWMGGTYLSPLISAFKVYSGTSPGGAVSFAAPLDTVPAYDGAILDGWGLGGWNQGGWGEAASYYSWTSRPLANGTWNFAVVTVDDAGNPCATPATSSVTIAAPPNPPAPNSQGVRLTYTFNASTRVATLNWLASP
jgi:hypothetical protein